MKFTFFTFCIILLGLSTQVLASEIKFNSPELQKLHAVVKDIKAVPLFDMEICKVELGKELITEKTEVETSVIIDKLKEQVSEKENVDIANVHTLKELFNYTNFSSFSGVLDNTFCFVNLPQNAISQHADRVKLFEVIKEISSKVNFAVLLDDGIEQGTNITKLHVYGVDTQSNEAFAIKAEVE